MTSDAVVRTWFEEVWNQGKEEKIHRLMKRDCLVHGLPSPDGLAISGPEAFMPFFRKFRSAFPDIHVKVKRTVTEGEMVAVHCHVTGSHRGDALGHPATGKTVAFWGMCFARVREGQIVEAWNQFDFLALYQQLGLFSQLPV